MKTDLARRAEAAERIARDAGEVARQHYRRLDTLAVEMKGRQDYVSSADREVEALVRNALDREFPDDGFLGEESGGAISDSMWVVDPIDGTSNFLRGLPLFGVSIAWVCEGEVHVGVIYEPALDRMFVATSETAATLNGQPIRVRTCASLDDAVIAFGYSERSGTEEFLTRFSRVLREHAEFRRLGAATVGLTSVACGQTDAFFQTHLSPWDVLAGLLIVERAGGVTKNFLKNDGLRRGNVCFASAAGIAERLGELLEVRLDNDSRLPPFGGGAT